MKNKNIKAGIWYTISNFVVKGASFLATPIILRIVSQETYGNYVNFNSWLSILMIFATGYLFNSILCAQFDFKDHIKEYVTSITILSSGIVLICFLVALLFKNPIENIIGIDFSYVRLMFAYLMVDSAYQNLITYDRMILSYKRVVLLSGGLTIFPLIGSILGALFLEDKLKGLLYGKMFPMIIICFAIYIHIMITGKGKIAYKYFVYALKISLPYIPHALSSMLLITSDRIIIQQLFGPSEVAQYNVVYTCAMVVSLVYNAMSQAWSPWLIKNLDEKNYTSIRKNAKPYYLVFIIFAVCAMLIAPELLWVIGGNEYTRVANMIPPIMAGIVIQYYYSYFVNIEFYYKKTLWISFNTITATIINIVLNYLFIPKFGIVAAAYTTLFGYVCLLMFHYLGAKRLQLANIYDNKWHVVILALYLLLMIACIKFLYNFMLLRYALILLIFLICIFVFLKKGRFKQNNESMWGE